MHDREAWADERAAQEAFAYGDIGRGMALEREARQERREARFDRREAAMEDGFGWDHRGGGGRHPFHHHTRYGPGYGYVASEVGLGIAAGAAMTAMAASAMRERPRTSGMEVRHEPPPPGFHAAGTSGRPVAVAYPAAVVAPPSAASPGGNGGNATDDNNCSSRAAFACEPPPPASAPSGLAVPPPPATASRGSPSVSLPSSPTSAVPDHAAAYGADPLRGGVGAAGAASPLSLRVTGARLWPDGVVRYSIQVRTTLPALLTAARAHPECAAVDVVEGSEVASFVLNRRYNDFKNLHDAMLEPARKAGVVLPIFPAGGVGQWLRKGDSALWAERQGCFARTLAVLASSPALWAHGLLAVWLVPDGR